MARNKPSLLLSEEENQQLFLIMGPHCLSRATAVVQLYGTEPPQHDNWQWFGTGVATFTKDHSRLSFYIQVYDLNEGNLLFEQELYKEFVYVTESTLFHQFEIEGGIVGINFAADQEAYVFARAVNRYLESRAKKEAASTRADSTAQPENEVQATKTHVRARKTRKYSKSDIGNPENFRHVQHVGFDSATTQGTNLADNLLSNVLEMVNIQPKDLEDPQAETMFFNFIQENGGLKKVYKKIKKIKGRKSTKKNEDPTVQIQKSKTLPEIPERSKDNDEIKKRYNAQNQNFQIPEIRLKEQEEIDSSSISKAPPPLGSPPIKAVPPPPPPPGLKTPWAPEALEVASTRHPEDVKFPPQHPGELPQQEMTYNRSLSSPVPSSRDDLLSEIRNPSIRLRHVDRTNAARPENKSGGAPSIICSLAQVLEDRRKDCLGSSDEDSSDSSVNSDDDSDW